MSKPNQQTFEVRIIPHPAVKLTGELIALHQRLAHTAERTAWMDTPLRDSIGRPWPLSRLN